jgi:chaperonin GroEL
MSKTILYHDKARRALERGMQIMVEAVSVTLGPRGRNVVIEKRVGSPQIVNDGVTIAKEIVLPNPIENTGVALIRQAAAKTNDVAGDGTTTSTVLAHAIVQEGMKNIVAGYNPIILKIGINKATKYVIEQINECAQPIENIQAIAQVATISAGNDTEVGNMIAEALNKVGKDGIISLEEGKSITTELEVSEGMRFDKGFISPYFVNQPERMEVVLENPYILLTDKKITLVKQDLIPILEQVTKTKRSLLIIADDVEKEALATLVLNKLRGILSVAAVRVPGFGQIKKTSLEDLSILTNGQLITEDAGYSLKTATLDLLGQARRVIITKDSTTIINEGTKLSGGVAIIKVGAVTETEMKEKKLRLEDAINATRAAVEEGIVPGGGAALTHLSENLNIWAKNNLKEEELLGAFIVAKAMRKPLKRIVENSGLNGEQISAMLIEKDFEIGYDAYDQTFVNMYEKGILDPAKVVRSTLQNAASIASMILTTECLVVKKQK